MLNFRKAIAIVLDKYPGPVITRYALALIIARLATEKTLRGEAVDIRIRSGIDNKFVQSKIKMLCNAGVIHEEADFPKNRVYRIWGRKAKNPGEAACCVDPFCFLSHISAMAYHGITDRIPSIVQLSAPGPTDWRKFADERMRRDFAGLDVSRVNFPKLERVGFHRIQGHPIRFYSSSHPGAFKTVPDSLLRVATLGRTFLDMLRQPKLCGGIRHAVDVYREYAESYLKLIVEEVDRNGTAIEKVRAGYLLEEACGLEHEKIEGWRQFVQRGGSRKLDPNEAYGSEYSEKWCLSINI